MKKAMVVTASLFVSLFLFSGISSAYTDYETCQTVFLHAYGIQYITQGSENYAAQIVIQGNMTSNDVVQSINTPPYYVAHDYIEFNGIVDVPLGGSGVVRIDGGYTYGGIYYDVASGSGIINVTQYNSTTVQLTVTAKSSVEYNIIVDSNQFLAPSSTQYYFTGIWADYALNSTSVDTTVMESC